MSKQKHTKKNTTKNTSYKLEAEDYYFNEDGLVVLTEAYHKKKGYCCERGCKHCPYKKD